MAMMGAKDGERGSYPEIVDSLAHMERRQRPMLTLSIGAWSSTC
jgi:hypothetical protein